MRLLIRFLITSISQCRTQAIVPIQSAEELGELMQKSNEYLIIIDAHKKWCGPCEAMWPSFQSVRAKTPKHEKRMIVYSAEIESFDADIQKLLPADFKALNGRGCSPMFVLLRNGEVVAAVEGCNVRWLRLQCTSQCHSGCR